MMGYENGFHSIKQLISEEKPDECHFILEYENFELLKEFAKTIQHDFILRILKKHQLRSQIVKKYNYKL